jgi:NADH:ubiquinone oxidoreductase subunit 6 (subunit J)
VQETSLLELIIFTILSSFMLGGALVMITNKQTVFSAFGFLVAMIALAGIFAMLESQFLAVAQIMVSVGAVVILSLLTILTINAKDKALPEERNKWKWIILSSILVAPITLLLYKTLTILPQQFSQMPNINAKVIGETLYSNWVLPFEILSILLLTAMVGAIVIARKDLTKESK